MHRVRHTGFSPSLNAPHQFGRFRIIPDIHRPFPQALPRFCRASDYRGDECFRPEAYDTKCQGARWGVETVDTTARMRGLHVRLVPEADVEAEWICLLGAFFDMSPLGGTPLHQGAATLKGLTRSSLASRVLCF